jgi:hypothetical protein
MAAQLVATSKIGNGPGQDLNAQSAEVKPRRIKIN